MNTVGELQLPRHWLNPQHSVATALHIMSGHGVKVIGILEGERLIGTVTLEDALRCKPEASLFEVMQPIKHVIQISSTIRSAAEVFYVEQIEFAAVLDGDKWKGILTPVMLLRELGRSFDPLTGLSWSDRLRNWGVDHLKNGDEVTILFIDLNDFGQYNKLYGHIVGDRVLQKVTAFLSEQIDPVSEVLVRYGGDEFAIGTLRDGDDAERFAAQLKQRGAHIFVGEAEKPVQFSIGVFGGRRHKERENVHYAATLDNLINIASKRCQQEKADAKPFLASKAVISTNVETKQENTFQPLRPIRPGADVNYRVIEVYADDNGQAATTVLLSSGDTVTSGAHSRRDITLEESIAQAAVKALEREFPSVDFRVDTAEVIGEFGDRYAVVTGHAEHGPHDVRVTGRKKVLGEVSKAIAEAAVEAFFAAMKVPSN